MDMEGVEGVGSYASFVSRVGSASSELREVEGTTGDSFMMEGEGRDRNMVTSSSDESDSDVDMFDETTFIVTTEPDPSENADKMTLVIPPEEIQGFLRKTGLNCRPRTGIKVKKENGQFLCPICDHPFKQTRNAITHSYTHMNLEELGRTNIYHQRCPHCPNKIFFNRRSYADHINSHEGIKNFKCQICQKGFRQKGHLERHMLTHVNQRLQTVQTPLPFRHIQCYFCQKKFANMSLLIRHMVVHTQETPFKCSYCNKWFTHESTMTSHIRRFHSYPDNPKPFTCDQCAKTWSEKGQLNWHIQRVHGEKTHHCSTCSKSFSAKWRLDVHVDGVHGKIRRHPCPQCQKTYSTKSDVMRHMRKEHN